MFVGISCEGDPAADLSVYWGQDVYAEIEALGFDGIFTGEHFATYYSPVFDTVSLTTAIACATQSIKIGTACIMTPMRHPSLLAKEFACVDQISNGRLILGLGIGGEIPSEFHAMDVPLRGRGPRTAESIEIVRRYLGGERFSYHGKYFDLDDVWIDPPAAQARVPIWYTGRADPARRRAALLCDGFLTHNASAPVCGHMFAGIREHAERGGRELPADFAWGAMVPVCLGEDRASALQKGKEQLARTYRVEEFVESKYDGYLAAGSAADCVEGLLEFAAAGCTHLVLSVVPERGTPVIESLRRLASDVLPKLR